MTSGPIHSPKAEVDLRRIVRDSLLLFGPRQARRHIERIKGECVRLEAGRSKGRPLDAPNDAYPKRRGGVHAVIFRIERHDRMRIVRILHSRMDLGRHL